MSPAAETVVSMGGVSAPITMRVSLRAAAFLEQRHGFESLYRQINEGHLGALADVVAASGNGANLLAAIDGQPLARVLPSLVESAAEHVGKLTGATSDKSSGQGERVTFADYHAKLFKIATGWLCWSPEEAWSATPDEILAAYAAHIEMLRAIHGSADDKPVSHTPDMPDSAALDRAGLQALKFMGGA